MSVSAAASLTWLQSVSEPVCIVIRRTCKCVHRARHYHRWLSCQAHRRTQNDRILPFGTRFSAVHEEIGVIPGVIYIILNVFHVVRKGRVSRLNSVWHDDELNMLLSQSLSTLDRSCAYAGY